MRSEVLGAEQTEPVRRGPEGRLTRVGYLGAAATIVAVAAGSLVLVSNRSETVGDQAVGPAAQQSGDEGASSAEGSRPAGPTQRPLCGSTLPAEVRLFGAEDPALVETVERIDDDGRLVHIASFEDREITVVWPMVDRFDAARPRPDWDDLGYVTIFSASSPEDDRIFLDWNSNGQGSGSDGDQGQQSVEDIEVSGLVLGDGPCGTMSFSGSIAGEVAPPYGFIFDGGASPVRISRDPLVGRTVEGAEPPPVGGPANASCPGGTFETPAAYFGTAEEALESALVERGWADYAGFTKYVLGAAEQAFAGWLNGEDDPAPLFVFHIEQDEQGWTVTHYDQGSGC